MKRLLIALFLLIAVFASSSHAADFLSQNPAYNVGEYIKVIKWNCKGAAPANTATNTENTRLITGWFLYKVIADPGGTAPDAADVLIYDTGGEDQLNGNGTNLIHATSTQSTYPEIDGQAAMQPVIGALTLDVDNQGTANALYDIWMIFKRY